MMLIPKKEIKNFKINETETVSLWEISLPEKLTTKTRLKKYIRYGLLQNHSEVKIYKLQRFNKKGWLNWVVKSKHFYFLYSVYFYNVESNTLFRLGYFTKDYSYSKFIASIGENNLYDIMLNSIMQNVDQKNMNIKEGDKYVVSSES